MMTLFKLVKLITILSGIIQAEYTGFSKLKSKLKLFRKNITSFFKYHFNLPAEKLKGFRLDLGSKDDANKSEENLL